MTDCQLMMKSQHRDLLTTAVDCENTEEAGGEIKGVSTDENRTEIKTSLNSCKTAVNNGSPRTALPPFMYLMNSTC